jgi:8-oxo-dGTP diphosphatase
MKESLKMIIESLQQKKFKNMNMLYFMENNPVHSLDLIGNSVILRGESDQQWVYISSPNEQEFSDAASRLKKDDRYFAAVEDWMLPLLKANKTTVWQLSMLKLVLPESVTFPKIYHSHITPLSINDAEYLYEHSMYQGVTSPEYIRDRIQSGPSAGIHSSGKLVAWAMTHDDSAIGFLNVVEAYRRKGYANELMIYLIHQLRQHGRIPFAHIEDANIRSINMAMKVGFRTDRRVHWLEVQSSH